MSVSPHSKPWRTCCYDSYFIKRKIGVEKSGELATSVDCATEAAGAPCRLWPWQLLGGTGPHSTPRGPPFLAHGLLARSLHPQARRTIGTPGPGKASLRLLGNQQPRASERMRVTWAVLSPVLSHCLQCPAGHFCPSRATHPIPCQPGTFNPRPGQDEAADCVPCPAGRACTQAGLTQPGTKCTPG